mmetsp:Transcript_16354/g.47049  ORF Transcript_16354/g.47049 Transcript_16354/m.47049 type:complete len:225 (-) Transcript_16354:172-846(-)
MTDSSSRCDINELGPVDVQQQYEIMAEIQRQQKGASYPVGSDPSSLGLDLRDKAFIEKQCDIYEKIKRQKRRNLEEQTSMLKPRGESSQSVSVTRRCHISDLEAKAAALSIGSDGRNKRVYDKQTDKKICRNEEIFARKSYHEKVSGSCGGPDEGEVMFSGKQKIRLCDKRLDVAKSAQKQAVHCLVCDQCFFVSHDCKVLYCPDCKVLIPTRLGSEVGAWRVS